MVIVSLATKTLGAGDSEIHVLLVTYFNYEHGEGVLVPLFFQEERDMNKAFELMKKVARLQGGASSGDDSLFSAN